MKTELKTRTIIKVRFNEADSLGIVWHGHYIRYFEDGREDFGNQHGIGYLDAYKHGFVTPVVSVQCDFKRPLKYGDSVIVETKFIVNESAKIKFAYQLYNQATNELVAAGTSVQVFLEKDSLLLQLTNPAFFEDWKKRNDL